MTSKKFSILLIFFSTILYLSCEKATLFAKSGEILVYGTSFGECQGPCYQEVLVNEKGEVEFLVRYNGLEESSQFNTFMPDEVQQSIENEFSLSNLQSLDDVIGCPDCADGGAEWLELRRAGQSVKKVTFEFGKAPKEIEKVVDLLRMQKELLSANFLQN